MRTRSTALAALVFVAAMTAAADSDDDARGQEAARRALARGEILPLSEILAVVKRDFDAPLADVEFEREYGRYVYEIVLLPSDGAVVELYFDAATAELLAIEREGESRPRPSLFQGLGRPETQRAEDRERAPTFAGGGDHEDDDDDDDDNDNDDGEDD